MESVERKGYDAHVRNIGDSCKSSGSSGGSQKVHRNRETNDVQLPKPSISIGQGQYNRKTSIHVFNIPDLSKIQSGWRTEVGPSFLTVIVCGPAQRDQSRRNGGLHLPHMFNIGL